MPAAPRQVAPIPAFTPPFVIAEPARQTAPFVFNAPHAGDVYPPVFLAASCLDPYGWAERALLGERYAESIGYCRQRAGIKWFEAFAC